MKKPVISLLLLLCTFVLSAQISTEMLPKISPNKKKSEHIVKNTKTTPVWEVTFEEETPVWTFGSIVGTKTWAVSDTTPSYGWTYEGVETSPLWIYMGDRYVHDYSVSGGNFAWIDGVSDILELLPYEVSESYIQFDNIDLSSTLHPKLAFYQNYKDLNDSHTYIEFSVDGVTWSSIEINSNEGLDSYGDDFKEVILPVGGESDVSLRFKWTTTSTDIGGYGYGWQIDDLSIVENPDYEIKLVDARMNFYEYVDYTQLDYQSYFHMSSHYGKIPQQQYDSYMALSYFNIMVENRGNQEIIPITTVVIYDPDMIEVFNTSKIGNTLLSTELDTIDLIDVEFILEQNPMLGLYTVEYTVSIDGQLDENELDNTFTTYFEITESEYSRSLEEPDGETGPSDFVSGGYDGDQFGTTFLFTFESQINSVDLFIGENSSVGSSFVVNFMVYDQYIGDWTNMGASSLITLDETDLGQWMNIIFNDMVEVTIPDGDEGIYIMISVEMFYNGYDDGVLIGYDSSLPVSPWGTYWNFSGGDDSWYVIDNWKKGGLAVNLNIGNAGLPCPEDLEVCIDMEPFTILEPLPSGAYFSGTGVENNVFYPATAGVGEHLITYHYFESYCTFYINVNPLPEQKIVNTIPVNGIIEVGTFASIEILESSEGTSYWTTLYGEVSSAEILGNGGTILLGDDFVEGTYVIWSRTLYGCEQTQGFVTIVENDNITKIVTNISYGASVSLFNSGDVNVSLYKENINESDEVEILLENSQVLDNSGTVMFNELDSGVYYLSSELINTDEYSVAAHVYYNEQMIFEEATPIVIEEGEIIIINISHPLNPDMEGSNNGTGTVGNQEEGKALDPEEGKVVVLKNVDTEEILSVCVTDENGYYEFEGIPDNTNIQLFVSNFETPNWFAYNTLVTTGQNLEVDFIVHQDSVYPSSFYNMIEFSNVQNSIEFYPNPVSDILHFENNLPNEKLTIYDNQGKVVLSVILKNDRKIDVSSLNSGLYIIVGTQEGEMRLSKFIKD